MENENQNIENTPLEQAQPTGVQNNTIGAGEPLMESDVQSNPVNETPIAPVSGVENTVSSPQVEQPTPSVPVSSEPPKKKSIVLPIVIVSSVVVILIAVFAIFLLPKFLFTGKKAIENEITSLFDKASDSLKESSSNILNYDLDKDSVGFEGSLTVDTDYKDDTMDLTKLKNYKISYSGVIDKKENEASGEVVLTKNSTDLIIVDAYAIGKNAYISLGKIFQKQLHTDIENEIKDLDLSKSDNTADLQKLLDKTEEGLKLSIDEKKITKTKENGYTKVTYNFTEEDTRKVVYETYLKDPEVIKILAELSNKTEDEIKTNLNDEIKADSETTTKTEGKIVLYLEGFNHNFKKTEITSGEDKLIIEKESDTYKYSYFESSEEKFNGTYNEKEGSATLNAPDLFTLSLKEDGNKLNIVFDYNDDTQLINITATMTNKVENNKQTNNSVIKIKYTSGYDTINATINNDIVLEKNKAVKKIGTQSEVVDIDDLTDEDNEIIESNLYAILGEIMEDIMPGYGTYDYDDYDYDYGYTY